MAISDTNDLDTGATLRGAATEQKLFGRYTLKKVLGRGGMGVVWLAHDDELVRNVAMKFLPDMIVRDREAVEDLKRETRRSLDLTHHHIVRIYDFTQDDQCAAIIMEYVDGESLSALKVRQDGGCFSVSSIQSWVSHFCQAMDYAHRQARVVHRDLKPANLMVNGRGDLKVTDFGISRSMSDSMTRVSMSNSAGTLAYMSPEQALGSPPAVGDDVYAFGATVFDMLTGRPPFFRGNLQVQLETVIPPLMEARRTELGNTGDPIPALWEEVIAACLAKRPQDRPQGMMEIASLLGVSGTTTTGYRPSTQRSNGGANGPGTSPTALASTTHTTPGTEVQRTGTAPTSVPATGRTAAANRTLQPTRAEDVLFGYTPPPSTPAPVPATARTAPVAPPPEPAAPPVEVEPAPPVQPEPIVEAVAEPPPIVIPPAAPPPPAVEPEPEPVEAKAPPQVSPDSVTLELSPVAPPPTAKVPEIPLVPPTEKPPVAPADPEEFAGTLIMPAVEPPAELAKPKPVPPKPAPTQVASAPLVIPPPPPTSVSTRTNVGHMIGSGASKKSSNKGLILGGVGVIVLVALLGLLAGRSPAPDPRKAELAAHVTNANSALASGDLAAAEREIAAVQSLDPKNAALAALQSSLNYKKQDAEDSAAADKAAADKLAAIKAAADKAAADKLAADKLKEKQIAEQQSREQADRERLAKLDQDKTQAAEMAARQQQQQQYDAAVGRVNDAISRKDVSAARTAVRDLRPNDAETKKLMAQIEALDDKMKGEDDDDTSDKKPRGKGNTKKTVAEVKPRPKPQPDPEPPRQPKQSQPTVSRPPSNPPSGKPAYKSFNSGGAPGG